MKITDEQDDLFREARDYITESDRPLELLIVVLKHPPEGGEYATTATFSETIRLSQYHSMAWALVRRALERHVDCPCSNCMASKAALKIADEALSGDNDEKRTIQ